MASDPLRIEILRRIDIRFEFEKHGGRIPPNATLSRDGWLSVHAIDREDEHPCGFLLATSQLFCPPIPLLMSTIHTPLPPIPLGVCLIAFHLP